MNRVPVVEIEGAETILKQLDRAFTDHEAARESSTEFKHPNPSPWRSAQIWAQVAVDRPEGAPLPPYAPELDPPEPESAVSFAIGVALGRFGAQSEGILDGAPKAALETGILFVGPTDALPDSLAHPAAAHVLAAWEVYMPASGKKPQLAWWTVFRWLRKKHQHAPVKALKALYPPSKERGARRGQWHHRGVTLFVTGRTRVGPYRLASARRPPFAIHHGEPGA